MKHNKYIILMLLGSIFLLNACQKNIDFFVADPGQNNRLDTNWVAAITDTMPVAQLQKDLLLPVYTDSFFFNRTDTTIETASGLNCAFRANSFVNAQNQPVSGIIHIQTLLLQKKGDMVRMNKATNTEGNEVVSGGELLVKALLNGNEISLSQQSSFNISYADTAAYSPKKLFYGDEANPLLFNWIMSTDSNFADVNAANQRYYIHSNKTGWLAAGQPFQNGTGQSFSASLILPSNFTNANTMAYLINRNVLSVIKMDGDAAMRKFTSNIISSGNQYIAVVISRQGDSYFLGYQNTETVSGTTNITASIVPSITSLDNIIAYFNSL